MTGWGDWAHILWRLLVSMILAGAIGLEREVHGKAAGLRTHMLVALGSCLFTILSFTLAQSGFAGPGSEPTRIAAQIITGVGFLGAGTIIQGRGGVHGLTTAASIWLVAAIGMAAGGGFQVGAFMATACGVLVLLFVVRVEAAIVRRVGTRYVVTATLVNLTDLAEADRLRTEFQLRPTRWELERKNQGTHLRFEGVMRPKELNRLLEAFEARYQLTEMRVDRF